MERKHNRGKLAKPRKGSGVVVRVDSDVYYCDINVKGYPRIRKSLETNNLDFSYRQVAQIKTQLLEGKYFNKRPSVNLVQAFQSYWNSNSHKITNKANIVRSLVYLGEFLEKQLGSNVSLEQIESFHIRQYVEYRRSCVVKAHNAKKAPPKHKQRFVSDETIKKEIYVFSAANTYAKEVMGIESSPANISEIVKKLKPSRSLEAAISEEKQVLYFNILPDYLKLPVMFQRIYALRWGNVKKLKKEHICWDSMTISFDVKTPRKDQNQKSIKLPITQDILNILVATGIKPMVKQKGFVFTYVNRSNQKKPLGDHKKAFMSAMKKAGIEKQRGQLTHLIRHTAATDIIRSTGNLMAAKNLLGHADVKTTQKYVHLARNEIGEAMSKGSIHVTKLTQGLVDTTKSQSYNIE